jgi:hypothetical protein
MMQRWRAAADVRAAVMSKCFLFVCILVVSFWAMALVVIDQILTLAWLTCMRRAIRNVNTCAAAVVLNLLGKAAVANAFVVVNVNARGVIQVTALSMDTAFVVLAVVHVLAPHMRAKLTIGLTARRKIRGPSHQARSGVTFAAFVRS